MTGDWRISSLQYGLRTGWRREDIWEIIRCAVTDSIVTTGDFRTDIGDSVPAPLRFIRLRITGGVTSKNERQRSADTSLSSTVLSAARVKVAPQRCLIGLLTKVLSLLYVLCVYTGYFSEPTFFRVSSTLFFTSSLHGNQFSKTAQR